MDALFSLGQVALLLAGAYAAWLWMKHAVKHRNPLEWKSSDFPLSALPSGEDIRAVQAVKVLSIEPVVVRPASGSHFVSGHHLIDTQHQRLCEHASDLRAMNLSGRPLAELERSIDAFVRDMAHHFLEEDAVLAAARHPAAEKHAAEHRQLVSSLTALVQQFRAGVSGMDHLVRFVCQEVVLNHIEGADRELEFRPQPVVAA